MYSIDNIKNWLFVDVETASEYSSLHSLQTANNKKAELWRKRCEYLRVRYPETKDMSDDDLYIERAPLHPEFAKVGCVCLGIYTGDANVSGAQVVGYAGHDEADVLAKTAKLIRGFYDKVSSREIRRSTPMIAGHNIKRFDVPVLCKRMLINGIKLPELLTVHDKKPWEMPFVDTAEMWSFGTWQESFASLDLLANVLCLESSKDSIDSSAVNGRYWDGKTDEIKTYCQNDVVVTMNVILKVSNLPIVPFDIVKRA